jgi:phosphatidylserine/phosphatidylglycerophosphate/cardiolipin synthase-like enzyme
LLIDGAFNERAIAFIGGRNVADPYYGVPKVDDHTYIDLEVMMRGVRPDPRQRSSLTIGGQVSEYFDHIYFHLGNRELTRSVLGLMRGYERQHRRMEEAHREVEEILGLDKNADGLRDELLRLGFEEHHVDIVHTIHNLYRRDASREVEIRDHKLEIRNGQALMGRLEEIIPHENKEIVIVSPYLWMSQRQIRLLKAWLLKDPQRRLTVLTNSIMTSDNMPAQILVDNVIGPALMLDAGLQNARGDQFRRSVADQVQIYQYGRADAKELGGSVGYGKLHAKGMLLRESGVSVIGTFNNDPRSLLLNSEGAAIIKGGATAERFARDIEAIKAQSHLWGSDEYHAIRANARLGMKTSVARQSRILYQLLVKLNLWWLI